MQREANFTCIEYAEPAIFYYSKVSFLLPHK